MRNIRNPNGTDPESMLLRPRKEIFPQRLI